MKIQQKKYSCKAGWVVIKNTLFNQELCNLVLVFGSTSLLADETLYDRIRSCYPNALILLNSTAGEIIDTKVDDESISLTAIQFEKTIIKSATATIENKITSFEAGKSLASKLCANELKSILVFADGQQVNGSDLVSGLQENLPEKVVITGGLAGDGARFSRTLIGLNETPVEGRIAAIGFYGDNICVSHGSAGGWDSFGHDRLITKSNKNVLYELDNKPALDIYKKYLGEYAKDLPLSGLLFPLSIRINSDQNPLVRTILATSEKDESLTFAGNMPEGAYARLMTANFDRLIEGAATAAQQTMANRLKGPQFALLISCVGRKMVLNQRVEEEIEAVENIYGAETAIAGFYSYGEISPSSYEGKCELHNQTMTITTFSES